MKQDQLWDFYYIQKQADQNLGLCHTVNGKKFTAAIYHGAKSDWLKNFSEVILVESGIPYNDSTVTYNQQLIRDLISPYRQH